MDQLKNPEEFTQIIKRKRTKRQRTSPLFTTTSSGGAGVSGAIAGEDRTDEVYFSIPSPTSSGDFSCEDEDMANCLILLAQSCSKNSDEQIAGSTAGAGDFVCRTCDRNFPTFQALGGHRASHKKAKSPAPPVLNDQNQGKQIEEKYVKIKSPINKFHECSVCGSQFLSGQALGGHMRRHRTPTSAPVTINGADSGSDELFCKIDNKQSVSELDLNFPPAPEEDRREFEFAFTPNNSPQLVLSATALVCFNY
ncbi:hypothetical protein LguiB_001091 [Lonicera macranthoides]